MISNKLAIEYLEEHGSVLRGVFLQSQKEESKDSLQVVLKIKPRAVSKVPKLKKKF